MAHYQITRQDYHLLWDASHQPLLHVKDGDTVALEVEDFSNGLLNLNSTVNDLTGLNFDLCYPLAGPIYMEGAEPGDTLAVEVLDVQTKGWGWMAVLPDMGLLSEEFKEPYFRTFDISNREYIPFREDIHVPLAPSLAPWASARQALKAWLSCRLGISAAIWIRATSAKAPRFTCRSRLPARFSPLGMGTARKAMVKFASPRLRHPGGHAAF